MGLKCSCFGNSGLSKLRRKRRGTPILDPSIERMISIKDNYQYYPTVSSTKTVTDAESMKNLKQDYYFDSKDVKFTEVPLAENFQEIPPPDFEIKDGTLILGPSKERAVSYNYTASKSLMNYRESDESLDEIKGNTCHHSLPHIPLKPTLNFLESENENEYKSMSSISVSSFPQRNNEIILNPSALDSSNPDEYSAEKTRPCSSPNLPEQTKFTFQDHSLGIKLEPAGRMDPYAIPLKDREPLLSSSVCPNDGATISNLGLTIPPRRREIFLNSTVSPNDSATISNLGLNHKVSETEDCQKINYRASAPIVSPRTHEIYFYQNIPDPNEKYTCKRRHPPPPPVPFPNENYNENQSNRAFLPSLPPRKHEFVFDPVSKDSAK